MMAGPKAALGGGVTGERPNLSMSATLTAGQKYHLVVYNTDPSPSRPTGRELAHHPDQTLGCHRQSRRAVQLRGAYPGGGFPSPPVTTTRSAAALSKNGSHFPVVLGWTDGSYTGDPYYGALTDHWDNGSIGTMMLYGSPQVRAAKLPGISRR